MAAGAASAPSSGACTRRTWAGVPVEERVHVRNDAHSKTAGAGAGIGTNFRFITRHGAMMGNVSLKLSRRPWLTPVHVPTTQRPQAPGCSLGHPGCVAAGLLPVGSAGGLPRAPMRRRGRTSGCACARTAAAAGRSCTGRCCCRSGTRRSCSRTWCRRRPCHPGLHDARSRVRFQGSGWTRGCSQGAGAGAGRSRRMQQPSRVGSHCQT